MNSYKKYLEQKQNTAAAIRWYDLRNAIDSQDGKPYSLSLAHSGIKLMRCGQASAGAQNYHDSPVALNAALLEVIGSRFDELVTQAIERLQANERKALIDCSTEIESIQADITQAKTLLPA